MDDNSVYNRTQYEDKTKMDIFKKNVFDDKATILDDYSSNPKRKLHIRHKSAKAIGGLNMPQKPTIYYR